VADLPLRAVPVRPSWEEVVLLGEAPLWEEALPREESKALLWEEVSLWEGEALPR
jgi:hypothetical protein